MTEAFVELRINKSRGSGFYPVLVDDNENPFIDVEDIMSNWLDMAVECHEGRNFCQAVMQPAAVRYWIDAEQMQMGSEDGETINLESGSLVVHDGKLWLRYDVWQQWLSVSTNWTLFNYTLAFHPHFPLLQDLKLAREESRRYQYAQQQWRERMNAMPAVLPANQTYRVESRYRVQKEIISDHSRDITIADYDLAADLQRGTLLLSGRIDDKRGIDNVVDSWRYREFRNEEFHLLEVGNSHNPSSALFPAFSLKNAFRFDYLERQQGGGLFELADWTQAGAEIDVYKNDFLQYTIFTDNEGRYQIDNLLVSGGDRVKLKFYYPDGSEEERVISVAPDEGLILDKRQWDIRLLGGQLVSNSSDFRYIDIRYGLEDNLSFGVKEYYLPLGNNNFSVLDIDLAWRPIAGVYILGESFLDGAIADSDMRMDLTLIPGHALRLERRWLDKNSRVLQTPLLRDPAREYWRLVHRFGVAKWGWTLDARDMDEQWLTEARLDYRLNRMVRLLSTRTVQRTELAGINRSSEFGVSIVPADYHNIDVRRSFSSTNDTLSVAYRHLGGQQRPWDAHLGLSKSTGTSALVSSSLLWRINPALSIGLRADNSTVGMVVSWNDVVAPRPGPEHWDDFASGTLTGQINLPADKHSLAPATTHPLAGVRVRADTKTVMTDANGRFYITGLPPYQRLLFSVDKSTLDASLIPVEEYAVIYFRPGTHIDYSPALTWTAGIDGYLINRQALPMDIKIEVVGLYDNVPVTTVAVEEDGFFIAEGLVPGAYQLRLIGAGDDFRPHNFELPSGSDWVSGIVWQWDKVEPRH